MEVMEEGEKEDILVFKVFKPWEGNGVYHLLVLSSYPLPNKMDSGGSNGLGTACNDRISFLAKSHIFQSWFFGLELYG